MTTRMSDPAVSEAVTREMFAYEPAATGALAERAQLLPVLLEAGRRAAAVAADVVTASVRLGDSCVSATEAFNALVRLLEALPRDEAEPVLDAMADYVCGRAVRDA